MTKRREHGEGSILERGAGTFRLRYRINGKRYSVTFKGTRAEAKTKLRELLRSGDTGEHVAPDRVTVGEWIKAWLDSGAPGRRKKRAGRRTVERYDQLLNTHIVPQLGAIRLQALQATEIDRIYDALEGKIIGVTKRSKGRRMATRSCHHVHTVFSACLAAAVRKGMLTVSPMQRVEKVPSPGESDHGQVLDEEQLAKLVRSFKASVLYPIVAVAAFTGARRGEVLALRWSDLDTKQKTLRIERAIEETKAAGRTLKDPKSAQHKRTIQIDDDLVALLLRERDKHTRLVASVPDGAEVDLSLVRLPETALMFPSTKGETLDLTRLRDLRAVSRNFKTQAKKLGFARLTLKDLRGSHETVLLDKGVPVHVVAARCGHDPAVLLRVYAKRTKKADVSAAAIIGSLSKAALGA